MHAGTVGALCRSITTLRGLEPSATPAEIEAAARQYVRKGSGVQATSSPATVHSASPSTYRGAPRTIGLR